MTLEILIVFATLFFLIGLRLNDLMWMDKFSKGWIDRIEGLFFFLAVAIQLITFGMAIYKIFILTKP